MKQYEKVMIALIIGIIIVVFFSFIPFKGISFKKPIISIFEQNVVKAPVNETNCLITGEIALHNTGDSVKNVEIEITAVNLKGMKVGLYSLNIPYFEKDTIKRKEVNFIVELPCNEITHITSDVKSFE